jgi:hypothetical protein
MGFLLENEHKTPHKAMTWYRNEKNKCNKKLLKLSMCCKNQNQQKGVKYKLGAIFTLILFTVSSAGSLR